VTILGVLKHRPAATPLPATKSTKLGAGGVMSAVEKLEAGLSKEDFEMAGTDLRAVR
jgi:hypothetical protein